MFPLQSCRNMLIIVTLGFSALWPHVLLHTQERDLLDICVTSLWGVAFWLCQIILFEGVEDLVYVYLYPLTHLVCSWRCLGIFEAALVLTTHFALCVPIGYLIGRRYFNLSKGQALCFSSIAVLGVGCTRLLW